MSGSSPFDRASGFQSIRDADAEFSPPRKPIKQYCPPPKWVCSIIVLVVFGGVPATLFFLWPRLLTLTYASTRNQGDPNSSRIQYFNNKLNFTLNSTLNLYNPNYIPIYLKNISLSLSVPTTNHSSVKIGNGFLSDDLEFAARSHENFTVLTDIVLDVGTSNTDNVKAMEIIVTSCSAALKIPIIYVVKSDVPMIDWTGYQPSFDGIFSIDCPLPENY